MTPVLPAVRFAAVNARFSKFPVSDTAAAIRMLMKATIANLLLASTALASLQTHAQGAQKVCGFERKNALQERITLQALCEHYSPQTKAERVRRMEALRAESPACYDAVLADPEMQDFLRAVPTVMAENRKTAAITPESEAYDALLVDFYSGQCAALAGEKAGMIIKGDGGG